MVILWRKILIIFDFNDDFGWKVIYNFYDNMVNYDFLILNLKLNVLL